MQSIKAILYHFVFGDETKDTKDTISKKRELLQAFQAIEKECKKNLKKEKIKYTMENRSILSSLFNPDKELAPVLYATIDQEKKERYYLHYTKLKARQIKTLLIVSTLWIVDGK